MGQYLINDLLIFDTSNYLYSTSTVSTGFYIYVEYPFQSLGPGHGRPSFSLGFLIGSVTPPVGVAFFTAGAIANVRLEKVAVAMLPYLVALFVLLFILIVIPDITMFLPKALGFVK